MKTIIASLTSLGILIAAYQYYEINQDPFKPDLPKEASPTALTAESYTPYHPLLFTRLDPLDKSQAIEPPYQFQADRSPAPNPLPASEKPVAVEEPAPLPTYTFRMVLDAKERTLISSELNTPVAKIHKRMGDVFEPGELLLSLDDKIVQGNLGKAIGKRTRAQVEYEGKKQLYDQDLISFFELKDAEAALAEAESDYITAEKYLSASSVIAAYHGRVVKVSLEEYELAQSGKELIEMIRDDILIGRFLVPASLLPCLKPGAELVVEVNRQKKKSSITRLSPVIDPTSLTIKVETEIDNTDRSWIPGLIGKVTLLCTTNDKDGTETLE